MPLCAIGFQGLFRGHGREGIGSGEEISCLEMEASETFNGRGAWRNIWLLKALRLRSWRGS